MPCITISSSNNNDTGSTMYKINRIEGSSGTSFSRIQTCLTPFSELILS